MTELSAGAKRALRNRIERRLRELRTEKRLLLEGLTVIEADTRAAEAQLKELGGVTPFTLTAILTYKPEKHMK